MWIGTTSSGFESSLVVKMGAGEHGRTTREGCEISITPSGEGAEDLIAQVSLRTGGYLARAEVDQGVLPNFRFYKFIKRQKEIAPVDAGIHLVGSGLVNDMATMVRGTSWLGMFYFYFKSIPAPMTVKAPLAVIIFLFLARALGIGMLTPFTAILRADWIVIRLLIDYVTDTDDSFDIWYWAFVAALI